MGKNRHARQRDTALLISRIFDMLSLIERRTFSQSQVYHSTREFLERNKNDMRHFNINMI